MNPCLSIVLLPEANSPSSGPKVASNLRSKMHACIHALTYLRINIQDERPIHLQCEKNPALCCDFTFGEIVLQHLAFPADKILPLLLHLPKKYIFIGKIRTSYPATHAV